MQELNGLVLPRKAVFVNPVIPIYEHSPFLVERDFYVHSLCCVGQNCAVQNEKIAFSFHKAHGKAHQKRRKRELTHKSPIFFGKQLNPAPRAVAVDKGVRETSAARVTKQNVERGGESHAA